MTANAQRDLRRVGRPRSCHLPRPVGLECAARRQKGSGWPRPRDLLRWQSIGMPQGALAPRRAGGNPLGTFAVSTMTAGMGPWRRALHRQGRGVTTSPRLTRGGDLGRSHGVPARTSPGEPCAQVGMSEARLTLWSARAACEYGSRQVWGIGASSRLCDPV